LKVYVDNANSLPRALDNYYANLVSLSVWQKQTWIMQPVRTH
jgi:hypothetical protein